MDLTKICMQNKEALLNHIGLMYRDSLQLMKHAPLTLIHEPSGVYECFEIKDKIDHILQQLPLEYAFVIQKEFLEVAKSNWYTKRFSEEEYLHFKNGAIDAFLHCLYG